MNVGQFIFTISKALMDLGTKLYEVFTYPVNISFVSKILAFFGSDLGLPESISLSYILGGIGAVALLVLIIYNVFKL